MFPTLQQKYEYAQQTIQDLENQLGELRALNRLEQIDTKLGSILDYFKQYKEFVTGQ